MVTGDGGLEAPEDTQRQTGQIREEQDGRTSIFIPVYTVRFVCYIPYSSLRRPARAALQQTQQWRSAALTGWF